MIRRSISGIIRNYSSFRYLAHPGALAGVRPIDRCMAAGDHGLLNIQPVDEQLTDGPAISVFGDSAKAQGLPGHHGPQVITGSPSPFRLSPFPSQLRSVDAGQPDPFTISGPTGVAVIAAVDGDGLQGCSRLRQSKHQQQGS
tara:strand:+ start:709 stop:1134 length:426 start_codon:yes stop_codon:yes gene_type:complete